MNLGQFGKTYEEKEFFFFEKCHRMCKTNNFNFKSQKDQIHVNYKNI